MSIRWLLVPLVGYLIVVYLCFGAAGHAALNDAPPPRDVEIRLYNSYGQIAETWHAAPGTARPMYGEATIFVDSKTGKRFTIKGGTIVIVETVQPKPTSKEADEEDYDTEDDTGECGP